MATTANPNTKLTTNTLRRAVGRVLADEARKAMRASRDYISRLGQDKEMRALSREQIERKVRQILTEVEEATLPEGETWRAWGAVNEFLTKQRLRGAIKHWIDQGKATTASRNGARGCKRYMWTLRAEETRERRRREAKERREAEAAKRTEQRELARADAQRAAKELEDALGIRAKATSEGLTISVEDVRSLLHSLKGI